MNFAEQQEVESLRAEIDERRKRIATIQSRARMRRARQGKRAAHQNGSE